MSLWLRTELLLLFIMMHLVQLVFIVLDVKLQILSYSVEFFVELSKQELVRRFEHCKTLDLLIRLVLFDLGFLLDLHPLNSVLQKEVSVLVDLGFKVLTSHLNSWAHGSNSCLRLDVSVPGTELGHGGVMI